MNFQSLNFHKAVRMRKFFAIIILVSKNFALNLRLLYFLLRRDDLIFLTQIFQRLIYVKLATVDLVASIIMMIVSLCRSSALKIIIQLSSVIIQSWFLKRTKVFDGTLSLRYALVSTEPPYSQRLFHVQIFALGLWLDGIKMVLRVHSLLFLTQRPW